MSFFGINTPDFKYDFIARPISKPGTYVFYFDFSSAKLHSDQLPVLDRIVDEYKNRANPIIVIGETDGFGSYSFNEALALHRSTVIVEELLRRGIKRDHIELKIKIRCCRIEHPTLEMVKSTQNDRITWVHFN